MKNVAPWSERSIVAHRAIVAAKAPDRRVRLEAIDALVEPRIAILDARHHLLVAPDQLGHECKPEPHDPCRRRDLQHLWDSSTQALRDLKIRVWEHHAEVVECPFCGDEQALTLDHYLPRTIYPEFSVVGSNLIPACHPCNIAKSVATPEGTDRVLCPVVDDLTVRLVRCRIGVEAGVLLPAFDIDEEAGHVDLVKAAQRHFEILGLASRYRAKSARAIASFMREIDLRGLAVDEAMAAARSRAASDRASYGENRWTAALFDAIADHFERARPT